MQRAESTKAAARAVAGNPQLLAEARDKLSLVSRLAGSIPASEIYVCMQPLVIMFGPPDYGQDAEAEEMQGAWFDIYTKALAEHPREAIEIAVSEWIRKGKPFFPKPAELNLLAQETSDEIKLIAYRLRKAVERADSYQPAPKKTPEDAMNVKEMLADLRGPDGKIRLVKTVDSATKPSSRSATADALRRLDGQL